ncbi:MAG: molybdopterin-dependent oxidoreductase, partial [Chloroflexi bacterium]|nr:molybdopterin-dependent oxidoreductase [Chloroflexota bacterium]
MADRKVSRRDFIKIGAAAAGATAASAFLAKLAFLQSTDEIDNPLAFYPNRNWEKAYRDIYRSDQSFVFLCAPNDTHNCLLRAYSKRNVVTRIEASYAYGEAADLYGNRSSHRWEPRACNKGLSLIRKFYGDRRIKAPMVRKGFLDWATAGFPRGADGRPPAQYFERGKDDFVRVTWDQAYELVAKAQVDIATTYSGDAGAARLRTQGYDPDMIETLHGAGVRTLKYRGGMPFLGATRLMGFYREANMMALLDSRIRGIGAGEAVGARVLDSYSWHTDLPPGHPMVTGQQTVDFDLFTAENASLITLWGMNWISTKMPDSHWLTEARMKGAKVVVIACEYQSTANKADEVVIIRPGTDAALALGMVNLILRDRLFDEAHVKNFTDLPLLVRMDTLKLVRPSDVIPGYQNQALSNYVRVLKAGESAPPNRMQEGQYVPEALRDEWGDFLVWDPGKGQAVTVSRDDVGQKFAARGISPSLEGSFTVKT